MKFYLSLSVITFFIVYFLTPVMKKIAVRFDILDRPSSSIKTHINPTPYLGGAAIYAGIAITTFGLFLIIPEVFDSQWIGFFLLLSAVFLLGLIDDIKPIKPITRLMLHFFVAATSVALGFHIKSGMHVLVDYFLSAIWIAGCINALNIIDIMDGLSSGVTLFICISLVCSMYLLNLNTSIALPITMAVILAGACLGFLPHNFEKASIFMGDAGSTLLGFMLGSLSLALPKTPTSLGEAFLPLFFLGVPVFDVILVSILRLRKGISPLVGSKDHYALRMKKHGFTVKQVVIYSWLTCASLGMMAITILALPKEYIILPLIVVLLFTFMFGNFLAKVNMDG